MKPLSTSQQIYLSFGALALLVFAVSVTALIELSAVNSRFANFVIDTETREGLAAEIRAQADRRAIGVRDMVLVKTDTDRAAARSMAGDANAKIRETLGLLKQALRSTVHVAEGEQALVDRLAAVEAR